MKNVFFLPVAVLLIALAQTSASAQSDGIDLYSLDFSGGTIAEYVSMIKDATAGKEQLNIVVTENARDYRLPPIQVQASLEGAIGIIQGCSTDKNLVDVDTDPTGEIYIVRVEYEDPLKFTVDNIKELLQMVDKESLLSAIEIGLEMQGSGSAVTMKLHEETGLLFVKGPETSVEVVHQVIHELAKGAYESRGGGGARGGENR